jgi:hypothetical protein
LITLVEKKRGAHAVSFTTRRPFLCEKSAGFFENSSDDVVNGDDVVVIDQAQELMVCRRDVRTPVPVRSQARIPRPMIDSSMIIDRCTIRINSSLRSIMKYAEFATGSAGALAGMFCGATHNTPADFSPTLLSY